MKTGDSRATVTSHKSVLNPGKVSRSATAEEGKVFHRLGDGMQTWSPTAAYESYPPSRLSRGHITCRWNKRVTLMLTQLSIGDAASVLGMWSPLGRVFGVSRLFLQRRFSHRI
mgnify:CR=1 FL=1